MAGIGTVLKRTFFWSYERGTWQYDVAVVIILIFVLLTPPGWFHDEPTVGVPAASPQVALVAGSEKTDRQTYRVTLGLWRRRNRPPHCKTTFTTR
jgi:hypothetical protein